MQKKGELTPYIRYLNSHAAVYVITASSSLEPPPQVLPTSSGERKILLLDLGIRLLLFPRF